MSDKCSKSGVVPPLVDTDFDQRADTRQRVCWSAGLLEQLIYWSLGHMFCGAFPVEFQSLGLINFKVWTAISFLPVLGEESTGARSVAGAHMSRLRRRWFDQPITKRLVKSGTPQLSNQRDYWLYSVIALTSLCVKRRQHTLNSGCLEQLTLVTDAGWQAIRLIAFCPWCIEKQEITRNKEQATGEKCRWLSRIRNTWRRSEPTVSVVGRGELRDVASHLLHDMSLSTGGNDEPKRN